MKNMPLKILLPLFALPIFFGIFVFFDKIHLPKESLINPMDSPKPYVLREGKLPMPRGFLDSKVAGALSFESALRIAEEKYKEKNYESALIWAYRAYEFAPEEKDVWILYAKILHAMGYKSQALEILTYYKKHHLALP
ncbi:tetratricopeptide repeat protein [Helicobacter mustelae]|uniref:Transformation system protein n=1 Tax=Helicobacter mustelae (strain ATCC 43772 / CCUG 25715 / CIP 103759 / LMG 18044 / NCTC 12198 / R85-136P) TaxID=679897 RepID=D3UJK9_HELM1|nr:tetratricopeptide repeat protein [Helicobacter mustelae]CBG40685.1 Putative hypothetical protein [Helicobacter mustelae 12198]SQH72182.1 Uncharacterised protein [Helicobacter mustelae]STP13326.1 Uncharacterised protein [Helicobacter mustelae]